MAVVALHVVLVPKLSLWRRKLYDD